METRLRVLMRDGPIDVRFAPKLQADQYELLLKALKLCDTRDDMRSAAQQLAIEWQSHVDIDE